MDAHRLSHGSKSVDCGNEPHGMTNPRGDSTKWGVVPRCHLKVRISVGKSPKITKWPDQFSASFVVAPTDSSFWPILN